jgi:hypothetical protein
MEKARIKPRLFCFGAAEAMRMGFGNRGKLGLNSKGAQNRGM